MKKIILFMPYMGQLPPNFPLWVKSCGANPTIDWVLLTDREVDTPLPPNIRHIMTSMDDLRERFSARLGFPVTLDRPYKLVDYKPAYGYLFEDMTEGYDFWGHCDMDVVFGDIRAFFTDEIMDAYDKIQERGHLSIYRNTDRIKRLFMEPCEGVVDYRRVYTDPYIFCYDEFRGIWRQCQVKGIPYTDIDTLAALHPFRGAFTESLSGRSGIVLYWERGKTYMAYLEKGKLTTQEIMYVHFRKRPMGAPAFDVDKAEAFFLVPNTFLLKEPGPLTRQEFRRMRKGLPLYTLRVNARRLYQKYVLKPARWYRRRRARRGGDDA